LLAALIEAPEGAAAKIELGLLRAEGGIVPALAAVAMLPVDGGVCLIVTDLTPQRAYESVVAAQAFERSILDQALDAILQLDAGGRVIRASRAAFELCGRNPLLLPFIDAFPLDCPEGAPDLAPVLGGTAALRSREYSLRCANGVDATVLLSAGPLVDADGKACGGVVTMSDITERRLAEDRLRESDRHKDEFLAILAHELRNPLAPIRSAVEILRNTDAATNPDATYAIDIVGRQTANLVRLVDDLLDIHRIGQGKVELQLANIDMRSVVEQAIEITKPQVALKEHDFVAHLPSKPLPVHGDAVRLSQVIVNLVSNAAKYTPPHGKIELTLERSADSSEAVLSVTDDGMGIAPEMLARIFEPYQQAASRGRASAGLGLGLTVCRRLMELHGGSVEALSAGLGHGARFIVRLRLAEAVPAQAATTVPALGFCPALRVLVVDDNRDACDTLAHLLALSGHEVEAVADGAAALDYASRAQLDVVLLDIGLPGMDGYEVARRLRALPNGAQLRVIAMTGYGSAEARRQSRASGIDHHLVKPVDFGALQALLATTN
jgi:signal transduction histidine kinase